MESTRATRAVVDLARLERNWQRLRDLHAPGGLIAVVKGNAYGHGLVPAARFLQGLGQDRFAVAFLDEALTLRHAGIRGRILVLGPPEPGTWPLYGRHRIEATVASPAHLREALAAAREGPLEVQLKCDTGMGRIGVREDALGAVRGLLTEAVANPGGLTLRGVYSHLADAEVLGSDHPERQLAAFGRWREALGEVLAGGGLGTPEWHLGNSAALLRDPRFHLDCIRVGYALWAPPPFDPPDAAPAAARAQEAVLSLHTRVSHVKTMDAGDTVGYSRTYHCSEGEVIATLPIGYGDGWFRALGNRGQVLLGGRRCPVVGNVSMDQVTVSLGRTPCAVGDEAVLLGTSQQAPGAVLPGAPSQAAGDEGEIRVDEVAAWAGTIGYEVLTHLLPRVPRSYVYDGKPVPEP